MFRVSILSDNVFAKIGQSSSSSSLSLETLSFISFLLLRLYPLPVPWERKGMPVSCLTVHPPLFLMTQTSLLQWRSRRQHNDHNEFDVFCQGKTRRVCGEEKKGEKKGETKFFKRQRQQHKKWFSLWIFFLLHVCLTSLETRPFISLSINIKLFLVWFFFNRQTVCHPLQRRHILCWQKERWVEGPGSIHETHVFFLEEDVSCFVYNLLFLSSSTKPLFLSLLPSKCRFCMLTMI